MKFQPDSSTLPSAVAAALEHARALRAELAEHERKERKLKRKREFFHVRSLDGVTLEWIENLGRHTKQAALDYAKKNHAHVYLVQHGRQVRIF